MMSRHGIGMSAAVLAFACMPGSSLAAPATETAAGLEQEVDRLIAPYDKPGTPGLAIGVFHKGRVLFVKTAGYADIEHGVKVTNKTRFELASVSKQFTGVTVAKLAATGKLDLDADIRTYLPWVPSFGGAKITARQLLHHTSGLREQHELCGLADLGCVHDFRIEHFRNIVMRQKSLNFAPGTRYSYSNTGYMLLGEIVKAVTGKSFRAYSDEAVFRPLGMTAFFLDTAGESIPDQAVGYLKAKQGWTRETIINNSPGEAGVQATIDDMMKWIGYLGRLPQEDPGLYALITKPAELGGGRRRLYGFGLSTIDLGGLRQISHTGGLQGYATHMSYLPDEEFGVAVLTLNGSYDCVELAQKILAAHLGDKIKHPAGEAVAKVSPALLKELPGTFISPESNWPNGVDTDRIVLRARDGSLHIGTPLDEVEGGPADTPAVFRRDGSFDDGDREEKWYRPVIENGRVVAIDRFDKEEGGASFRYARVTPAAVGAERLADYAGRFCSDELDVCYDVRPDGAALVATSIGATEPIRMTSTIADRFDALSWYFVRTQFVRDAGGRVTGMNVSSYRALNSYFAKR